jgi:hypothetical protein
MKTARTRLGLGAALILGAASLAALVTPATANAAPHAPQVPQVTPNACKPTLLKEKDHIAGLVPAVGKCSFVSSESDAANGTPPLLFHGSPPQCSFSPCEYGRVMMTPSTSPLVVTPIFWEPADHPMDGRYIQIIEAYLEEVALSSGLNSNVYSVLNEYYGTNGQIHYRMQLGAPVYDMNALPASGCTVASTDTSEIYADGTGYNACLDDAQLQAEINNVTAARRLPHNLSHIYVLYLPKHVESCFYPGLTTTSANECTINYQPSAAYCAYHSESLTSAVYANMPYPIYYSKTGFTCGSEFNFGQVESPNNNPDADVEISPTSHEISEAITDPDTETGWYDSSGYEIGDECAYIYGPTYGSPGHLYNQTFFGLHFLTQEEFSNKDFEITGGGCVQSASAEA